MAQKGHTKRRNILLLSAVLSGLVAVTSLLLALNQVVAKEHVHHVAPSCTNVPTPCYTTVQEAVDAARDGDVIKVAAGTYTGVNIRPRGDPSATGAVTQVVYITKTVTIQGGYATADWTTPYPDTNPTTLDARGQGRVLYITGHASPTIEGLRITGGDAAGLVGFIDPSYGYIGDAGGGVYVFLAAATLRHNQVFSNTAGRGGGVFVASSAVTLDGNTVFSNSAEYTGGGVYLLESDKGLLERNTVFSNTAADGGGVFLGYSAATLIDNAISSNTAKYGGGVFLSYSAATLIDNAVLSNTASYGGGGGLYLYSSAATLSNNTVDANSAIGRGGGLFLSDSSATLTKNVISSNTAEYGGGLYSSGSGSRVTLKGNVILSNHAHNSGGGLYLWGCDDVIDDNTVVANTVGGWGGGLYLEYGTAKVSTNIFVANTAKGGGGLYLRYSNTILDGNTISANTASYGGGLDTWHSADTLNGNTIMANSAQGGGGLRLKGSSAPTLTNNLIFENQADSTGGGLLVVNSSPRLIHTTIANNGGSGIHVTSDAPYSSTVALTNTILAGHEVGIVVTEGSTATLEATLWDNDVNWQGPGTILTGTRNVWDDPGLTRRYHIGPNSAAINAGVDADLSADIDGDPRPTGFVPDLGADERPGAHLQLHSTVESRYVSPGHVITYTLAAISDGAHPVTRAALTNTLPASQRVVAVTATQGSCTATGFWGGETRCDLGTMAAGARVTVTLTAQVTTTPPPELPWSMRSSTTLTAAQTPNLFAQADTIGHECRVRLNDGSIEYSTIQAAVDGSTHSTDVVKVAGGYCIDTNLRAGLRQMVYLSKTLTIQGGWNTSFTTRDVAQYTTTLDAQGQGRVLVVAGSVSPTVDGLHITGGDAAGLGETSGGGDGGGGVYVTTATLTLRNSRVFSNTAEYGGGICLSKGDGVLSNNDITANSADYDGGGLYLHHSTVSLGGSTITSNTATYRGGGLRLDHSDATLRGNTISENTSSSGGGLYLYKSSATLNANTIKANIVQGAGGGLHIDGSEATLRSNVIAENTAVDGGGVGTSRSVVALEQNTITNNTATDGPGQRGWGGGLSLWSSGVTLDGNVIGSNAANQLGGGLYVTDSDMGASSNVIAGNRAGVAGSGMYIAGSSTRLLHTTVAHNTGGDGSGVYVTDDWSGNSTVAMSNTILAKHTMGITVAQGNRTTLEATLWGEGDWANGSDWGGAGMIETGTINLWDNPDFVDPASGDFHIGAASPAIDAGVVSAVSSDVDAEPRPAGPSPDIGADERPGASLRLHQDAHPLISIPGLTVTYSLTVTSAGTYTTTRTWLTDTLPPFQRAIDVTTDIGRCTADAAWGGSIRCDLGTLPPDRSVHITLIARVMADPPVHVSPPAPNGIVVTARETHNTSRLRIVLHNCHVRLNDSPVEYPSVQAAVDASTHPTDIVKVAGACPGVTSRAGTRQVVHLSKTLTIQGGWNISFTQRSVFSTPTTLDALGQGRVLYISGGDGPDIIIHPIIEGLRITGGDAAGLAGLESTWRYGEPIDGGGGVYASNAALTLRDSQVLNNTADCGGGLLLSGTTATLDRNTVIRNVARGSDDQHNRGGGGGLYLFDSESTLTNNTIAANMAPNGGGLYSREGDVALHGNTLEANTATQSGGGLYLTGGSARLARNTIARNVAYDEGGGASLHSTAVLAGDIISGNTAAQGGGLAVGSDATLNGTTIMSNTADYGGGLYLGSALMTNNVVAQNHARRAGSGLYVVGSPSLFHTTIAHNTGGDGSGVYVTRFSQYRDPNSVALTNTILAGHEIGIVVSEGNTATLEATLWGKGVWANTIDWAGGGTVDTGTINVWDDPGFVDAVHSDYHINAQSPAAGAGVASTTLTDADGDPRPAGFGVDIGADERPGANLYLHQAVRPPILSPGQAVTYTVVVHSGGAHPATHVWLTDTLPTRQQALAVTSTRGRCTANAGWGGQVVCDLGTMAPGERAQITLAAWVTRTQPVVLPDYMFNVVEITAVETSNAAYAHMMLHDCHARLNDDPTPYYTVQAAVDASTHPTDVVKVAGTCMDVIDRYDTLQIVHLSKTLTIQGGWNTDFTQRDVLSTPTTLDARGLGRVFFITGDVKPTIEGLHITGGNTRELHRYATSWDYVYHDGGGVYIIDAAPTFRSNRVFGNVGGNGGGVYLHHSTATFDGNVVTDNVARSTGGGLSLYDSSASLRGNTISANVARWDGGGLHLDSSRATLDGNTIRGNAGNRGGGLYLCQTTLTSTNSVVADNQADMEGSGLYIGSSSARLLHTTIARNTGDDGSGVYVSEYYGNSDSTVWLTNTILVGHAVGIVLAESGGTVTLEDTLWGTGGWANGIDWIGDGTIDAGTVNVWGTPAFADPAQGDYHITAVSTAIDMGRAAGVAWDIDGESRPSGAAPDLGADEWMPPQR